MKPVKLALFFILFSLSPFIVRAQIDTSILTGGGSTDFIVNPSSPGPNEAVTITLESYEVNLDNASISWSVDGVTVSSGVGVKSIETFTGSTGTTKTIRASIQGGGKSFSKTLTLRIGDVDLLWQGRGYVPPFYKGRNLWASQGFITIIAIPNISQGGTSLNRNNLVYRWSKNGTILGGTSGRGKHSFTFQDSILNIPQTIKVEVFNNDSLVASKTLTLLAQSPKVLTYENNPLLGYMFNYETASGFNLKKPEVTFASFPFFFSAQTRSDSSLSYEWSSTKTQNLESSNEIVYRIPENTSGTAYVRSSVRSLSQMLQGGDREFLVQFGNENDF